MSCVFKTLDDVIKKKMKDVNKIFYNKNQNDENIDIKNNCKNGQTHNKQK